MSSVDPTALSLESFSDSSRWEIVHNVPVFIPHKRQYREDGELKEYHVTDETLAEIEENALVTLEKFRVPPRIQIGHTRKDVKETDQAPIVGWAAEGFKRSIWQGKPSLQINEYLDKKGTVIINGEKMTCVEAAKRYPFRSVEYYPNSKQITAIALLSRDPELDMGILTFGRKAPERCFYYSLGDSSMAEHEGHPAQPAHPAGGEQKVEQGDETKELATFKAYMAKCYPHMERMHAEHAQRYAAAASGTNTAIPGAAPAAPAAPMAPPAPEAATHMQRNGEPVDYARQIANLQDSLLKTVNESNARIRELEQRNRATEYRAELLVLNERDGFIFNVDEELADAMDLNREQFDKQKKRIQKYERRPSPDAGFIPVARDVTPNGSSNGHVVVNNERDLQRCADYVREHGGSWDDAKKACGVK
jgi:hypothetical protein